MLNIEAEVAKISVAGNILIKMFMISIFIIIIKYTDWATVRLLNSVLRAI